MNARIATLALVLAAAACGEDGGEDDGETVFRRPQIVPDSNIQCLSYNEETVGMPTAHSVQLANAGREPLVINEALIESDARGSFRIDRLRTEDGMDCTAAAPCSVTRNETAFLRFFYDPQDPGWDTADLRVISNAQNFPRLRIFVLARARPRDLDPSMPYDYGPRPSNAVGADGSVSCPDR